MEYLDEEVNLICLDLYYFGKQASDGTDALGSDVTKCSDYT